MTTAEKALLILAANAPKEPTAAALREWSEQFERDYPQPECAADELFIANSAVAIATLTAGRTSGKHSRPITPHLGYAWEAWREECLKQFRSEWPATWAKQIHAKLMETTCAKP